MRPSDFLLNTDYLNVATLATTERIFGFASRTIFGLATSTRTLDLTVPNGAKGVPIYQVSTDGAVFGAGSYGTSPIGSMTGYWSVARVAPTVLRFTLRIRNTSTAARTAPAVNFWVRETLLSAPNVV